MAQPTPLTRFKSILKSRDSVAKKAALITELAPHLPEEAIELMDQAMDAAAPLVQVAMMDAYFEMTRSRSHKEDLERILGEAQRLGDKGEELYMAARLALGRLNRKSKDALGEWGDAGLEVIGFRLRFRDPRTGQMRSIKPRHHERITIIIHGTWAADGKWWRPGGDFFDYVKTELGRRDVYGRRDQFKWSGKNRDSSRRKAALSLDEWIKAHPASEVNVLAHSHGANVAMLATHRGIRIDRLVMLSPPVRRDYFAQWGHVTEAYNIQAANDPVVAIARGGKWFRRREVKEKELKADGHSASHDPKVWRAERLPHFIGMPWPIR